MDNVYVMTNCLFTKQALQHLLCRKIASTSSNVNLTIIDARYDKSIIGILSLLFEIKQKTPQYRCLNIVSDELLINFTKQQWNIVNEKDSVEVILTKIGKVIAETNSLSCEQMYSELVNNINLTDAQIKIATAIASHLSPNQIAYTNLLNVKTVYAHMGTLRKKLGISNRYDLYTTLANKHDVLCDMTYEKSICSQ